MSRSPITFRGGRLPADPDRPSLRYAAVLHPDQPEPPKTSDWLSPVPADAWGMLGNDEWGDCTCAGIGHKIIGDVCVNDDGRIVAITTTQTLGLYSAVTGFDPNAGPSGDNPTDQGAVCQKVLEYVRKNGFLGHKFLAFAKVDIHDRDQVKRAIATFGQIYCGFDVPDSAMTQFNAGKPWTVVRGSTIEGGHCVPLGAYTEDGPDCVTWAKVQHMTWDFFETYFEEAWVIVTPDMIDPDTGLDHLGINLAALESAFTTLTGTRIAGR